MFCMARGSYVDECLNNHTRDLCTGFQSTIQVVTNRWELRFLPLAVLLDVSLQW